MFLHKRQSQGKPWRETLRVRFKLKTNGVERLPAVGQNLIGVGLWLCLELSHKDMVELVLGQAAHEILRTVDKVSHFRKRGGEAQLLPKPTLGRRKGRLSGARMATAGIGPEPSKVILPRGTLLEKELSLWIKDKNRERPVELPPLDMRGQLPTEPKSDITLIHQNYFILHH